MCEVSVLQSRRAESTIFIGHEANDGSIVTHKCNAYTIAYCRLISKLMQIQRLFAFTEKTIRRLYTVSPLYWEEFYAKFNGTVYANHEANEYRNGIRAWPNADRKVPVSSAHTHTPNSWAKMCCTDRVIFNFIEFDGGVFQFFQLQ